MKMVSRIANTDLEYSRWNLLYRLSGAASFIVGILFLIALIGLIAARLQPGTTSGWLNLLQNNWLIVLYKLNAGIEGVQFDLLHGLNPLDLTIMALVAMIFLGLYAALKRTGKIWPIIAVVLPFLGTAIFIATKIAGRSGVMAAVLVISFVMLHSDKFSKLIAFVGILASVLLLAGDFGTEPNAHSTIVAGLVGIGYVLMMAWFFLISQRLFQLGWSVTKEEV
jgi:hypothetical protein